MVIFFNAYYESLYVQFFANPIERMSLDIFAKITGWNPTTPPTIAGAQQMWEDLSAQQATAAEDLAATGEGWRAAEGSGDPTFNKPGLRTRRVGFFSIRVLLTAKFAVCMVLPPQFYQYCCARYLRMDGRGQTTMAIPVGGRGVQTVGTVWPVGYIVRNGAHCFTHPPPPLLPRMRGENVGCEDP